MEKVGSVLSVLGMLALMLAVFAGAYYVSRFMGRQYRRQGTAGRSIEILDQALLGKDGQLVLVRVKSKVYLVAAGPNGASKIDELDAADFPKTSSDSGSVPPSFLQVLKDAVHKQDGSSGGGAL